MLILKLTDDSAVNIPPSGKSTLFVDDSGDLALKDDTGTVHPIGGSGSVTSVDMSVPTGFVVSGNPIISSGTLAVAYDSGYQGYTTAESTKLSGIEAGAEVNVQADWNASGTEAEILNKPVLGTAASQDTTAFDVAGAAAAAQAAAEAYTDAKVAPVIQSITSASTITPAAGNSNVDVTALAVAASVANPSGTWSHLTQMVISITDNGTAQALSWDTGYRVKDLMLPTTTIVGYTLYVSIIYNSSSGVWSVVGVVYA